MPSLLENPKRVHEHVMRGTGCSCWTCCWAMLTDSLVRHWGGGATPTTSCTATMAPFRYTLHSCHSQTLQQPASASLHHTSGPVPTSAAALEAALLHDPAIAFGASLAPAISHALTSYLTLAPAPSFALIPTLTLTLPLLLPLYLPSMVCPQIQQT